MGAAADRSTKDKAMAAYLKKNGVKRTTMRCPMCHCLVSLGQPFYSHLSNHAGGRGKEEAA